VLQLISCEILSYQMVSMTPPCKPSLKHLHVKAVKRWKDVYYHNHHHSARCNCVSVKQI